MGNVDIFLNLLYYIGSKKRRKYMFFLDCPAGMDVIVKFIKNGVMPLIQFAVPIVIIILGSIDLFKAVIASKEDEIKAAQKLLIKREYDVKK